MPFYLLIDTVILRRLVSNDSISEYLLQLDYSVKKKEVILLCPQALQEEWQKHREEARFIIAKKLKEWQVNLKRQRMVNHMMADFTEEQMSVLSKELNSQIDIIDQLLASYAVQLPRTDEIDLAILKRRHEKKAPFHIPKKDNFNDAELLFYTAGYLQKSDINEFFLVSDNTDDFAIKQDGNFVLHPDIVLLFGSIKINFDNHIGKTFEQLYEAGLQKREKEAGQSQSQRKIKNVIQIDQSLPILDQVHDYLEKRFGDLVVIPKEIFAEHYPFITNRAFVFMHRPFTIITDNPAVHRLLTEVKIENGEIIEDEIGFIKTETDKKKINEVFKYLNQNLIYKVAFEQLNPSPIHFLQTGPECTCMECQYNRLRLDKLITKLSRVAEEGSGQTVQQKMSLAYYHYKMGYFVVAAEKFEQIRDSRADKKDVLQFIINFNLYNLGGLIKNAYFRDAVLRKRGEQLRAIDLDKIFADCRNPFDQRILEWIHQKLFYSDSLAKLHEETASIRDFYHGQNGGTNEHMAQVLETYHAAVSFLDKNAIVYDVFLEFHELTSVYTDAVFASHGCSKRLDGKLRYFDDGMLKRLALNGKVEEIQKFVNRYKIKKLIYEPSAGGATSFVDAFIHLLKQYHSILESHDHLVKAKNEWFGDFYTDILFNCIALTAVLELSNETINKIAEKLLIVQRTAPKLHPYLLLTHLKWFFSKNNGRLTGNIINEYIQLSVYTSEYHDDIWFQQLADMQEKGSKGFEFPEGEFESNVRNFTEECDKCKRSHGWSILTDIYKLTNNLDQKRYIIDRIKSLLDQSFDSSHYYLATTTGIIEPTAEQTKKYTTQVEKRVAAGPGSRFMPQTEYYTDPLVDQYLNFCFRYEFAIPDSIGKNLPALGPYYQWLIDLDGFDYTLFDPEWMFHYFTIFYKRRFRKSQVLKDQLLQLLTKEPTNKLAVRFVYIYCKND